MKKIFYLLATLFTFVACTSDEQFDSVFSGRKSEIHLTTRLEPMTRSNKLNLQSTQIVEGQKVGVYITGASASMDNACWTVGAGGDLTNQGEPIYWGKADIDVTAYQPYMTSTELSQGIFTVKTDQSADADYLNSDLLIASRSASQTNEAVPLTFYHKLSKIMVQLVGDNMPDITDAEVYVCGTNVATKFVPQNYSLSLAGAKTDIKACKLNALSPTGAAIIIPQTVDEGTKFIRVKTPTASYSYRLPSSIEFKSGYSYMYTLKINKGQVELELSSYQVVDWNAGGNYEGTLEEDANLLPGYEISFDKYTMNITMSGVQDGSDWLSLYGDKNNGYVQNVWVSVSPSTPCTDLYVENCQSGSNIATDIVFLVDNSGSMSEEANAIASQIESWAQNLVSAGLNVQFGVVGFSVSGNINGALNMTSVSTLKSYLDRTTGTSRTVGFSGSDASTLQSYANSYGSTGDENGVMALRMADEHFNFRSGANRVYIMFTDEGNQPGGKSDYSVEYVRKNWNASKGTVHVIFSASQGTVSGSANDEKPWLIADYTGGTKTFTNSSFTGVNLNDLDVSGALTHSYKMSCLVPETLMDGKTHVVTVSVQLSDGTKLSRSVSSVLPIVVISDHEYVDLGLPSGLKWATYNIGASKPSDTGLYFAWGETTGYTAASGHSFTWDNYCHINSNGAITKYNNDSKYGTVDGKTVLEASDDAATVNWGSEWRTPTWNELAELATYCSWTLSTVDGVQCVIAKGPNSKSITIPFAGYVGPNGLVGYGSKIQLWSSTLCQEDEYANTCAFDLLRQDESLYQGIISRWCGLPIRPVYVK